MNLTQQQIKESSDEQIVAECTTGNAVAWEEFISRFGRLIYSVAVRRGCKNADAEEVFQQTLTLAWQHLSQLKEIAGLRSWLVTTALRECWRVQRTTSKHDGAELLPGDRVVADTSTTGIPRNVSRSDAKPCLRGRGDVTTGLTLFP